MTLTEQPIVIANFHISILDQHSLALSILRLGLAATNLALRPRGGRFLGTFPPSRLLGLLRSCWTVFILTEFLAVLLIVIPSG